MCAHCLMTQVGLPHWGKAFIQLRLPDIIVWGKWVARFESEFFTAEYKPSKDEHSNSYMTSKSHKQSSQSLGLQKMKTGVLLFIYSTKSYGDYQELDSRVPGVQTRKT